MTDRYISEKALIENIVKIQDLRTLSTKTIGEAISNTPTADVEEVRHGEWKVKRDEYDYEYMMCSVCKEEFYPVDADTVDTTPNYCPNCGAKMNGERKQ